ncbi:MAG TPA: hypothetical protein PLL36_02775 [Candidatus Hydrogenedentes bacterium]|jgi:hypothetical protein|nr:hypothetical protein [Candidatus Hydrogenedentota bacterium]HQM99967.1 hypothetical protein [Candidatus Hydrogenedentota bacterium]
MQALAVISSLNGVELDAFDPSDQTDMTDQPDVQRISRGILVVSDASVN